MGDVLSAQTGAVRHIVPGKLTAAELAVFRAILARFTSRFAASRALGVALVTLDSWSDGFIHGRSIARFRKLIAQGTPE